MLDKSKQTIIVILIVLVGLGLMILGFSLYRNVASFRRTAGETTAIITDIQHIRRGSDSYDRRVYVSYLVDGREYNGVMGHWHSGMRIGQGITIHYDLNNPQNFRTTSSYMGYLIVILFGVIVFLVGAILLYKQYKHRSIKGYVIANGKRVMATVHDVVEGSYTVNNRTCQNLICKYVDERTGISYKFKSENIWGNPPALGKREIPLVPVYVDVNDYTRYYVAIDELFAEIADNNSLMDFTESYVGWSDWKGNISGNEHDELPGGSKIAGHQYDPGGFVIMWILMTIGGAFIYFWRHSGILGVIFGLFFVGIGVYAHIHFFLHKFAPIKQVHALLVSIDMGNEYMDYTGKVRYVLKFQDTTGSLCYFPTDEVGSLEENCSYIVTKKNTKVLEVGALVSNSMQFSVFVKRPNYMSGIYMPLNGFREEPKKLEMPFMLVLVWFIQFVLLVVFVIANIPTISIYSAPLLIPIVLVARIIYVDYQAKQNE